MTRDSREYSSDRLNSGRSRSADGSDGRGSERAKGSDQGRGSSSISQQGFLRFWSGCCDKTPVVEGVHKKRSFSTDEASRSREGTSNEVMTTRQEIELVTDSTSRVSNAGQVSPALSEIPPSRQNTSTSHEDQPRISGPDGITYKVIRKKELNFPKKAGDPESSGGIEPHLQPHLQPLRNLYLGFCGSKNDVESIEHSKNRKREGEKDSGGVFIRLKNFLRLQEKVDKIREAKGSIFIVSNRGPIGYKRVSDEAFEEVYGAGGVAVALRSVKKCTKDLVRFLSMPMENGDRDAQAAMEKLGYIPLKERENNGSSNKNNRKNLLHRSRSMNDIEQRGIENAENEFTSNDIGQKCIENAENEFIVNKDITKKDFENYYNKFSNIFLWLSFHGMSECILESDVGIKSWESYSKVNQAFANKLSKMIEKEQEQGKKPIVMLNDYLLLRVSGMLREKHPNIVLQHFIHIPWPEPQNLQGEPSEIVKGIYKGLSGNDIIGFQTKKDATNFLKGVQRFLPDAEVNLNESTVRWKNGDNTQVRVYPISIDVDKTRKMAKAANRESVKEMKKIVSVGRIDLIKNDVRVLESYGLMLNQYPKIRGKVIFTPRLVPSRQGIEVYENLQKEVKSTIDKINKKYSTDSWTPIIPDYGNDHKDALGKMVDADVVMVGSLADGMNLVALEAAAVMEQGVLVLSAKAGAHELLKEGVLGINDPKNTQEMAERLYEALMMSPEERQSKTAMARKIVERNGLLQWQYKQFSDICDVIKSK